MHKAQAFKPVVLTGSPGSRPCRHVMGPIEAQFYLVLSFLAFGLLALL